jgi:hypothetical protein
VKNINIVISVKCRASFPTESAVTGLVQEWKLTKDSLFIFRIVDHSDKSFKVPGDSTSTVAWGKPSIQKTSAVLRFLVSQLQIEAPPREELCRIGLERLKSEGVAGANQTLRLPKMPLCIGLLASDTSAGLEDFIHQQLHPPGPRQPSNHVRVKTPILFAWGESVGLTLRERAMK